MKIENSSIAAMYLNIAVLAVFAMSLFSCENGPGNTDGLRTVCFDTEVLPLIQSSCATTDCHDVTAKDGYRFDTYEGILAGVITGDPHKSAIYKSIITTGEDHMPPGIVLAINDRTLIRVWIEQGAVKSICTEPADSIINDTITPPYSNPYVCFERDILPVMQSSCGVAGCHDPFTMEEEFNFTTYQGILDGVKPGSPLTSKIYKSIAEDEPSDIMPPPPYDPLSQAQIDSIYSWILKGASDEFCGDACDTINITYSTHLASIVSTSCTGCHSGTSPSGSVRLESYSDLVATVNAGSVPAVLRAESGYSIMPLYGPLYECDIRKFEIWIENGMPN